MADRLTLHAKLKSTTGLNEVYFQPPSDVLMQYPCIVYKLDRVTADYADDIRYTDRDRYTVTLIERNPDSAFKRMLLSIPYCVHDRCFTADNLHHDVFVIYN